MLNYENTTDSDSPHAPTITPLDLRQATFPVGWRGYEQNAVRTFLRDASENFEHGLRENERLRHEVTRLEGVIKHHKEIEATLSSTLVHAQKMADDLRSSAQQEADRIVREAKGRAELMMAAAQNRQDDAQREIDGLKLRRREAESTVESLITTLQSTLEFIREQGREPVKVVAHRPRMDVAS
jgi:cell division initiation protein